MARFSIKPSNWRKKYAGFSCETVFLRKPILAKLNKFPKKIIPSARFSFNLFYKRKLAQ